jgi:chemotaxis signal transduction protein
LFAAEMSDRPPLDESRKGEAWEILAFRLNGQEFRVKTIAIREIRG